MHVYYDVAFPKPKLGLVLLRDASDSSSVVLVCTTAFTEKHVATGSRILAINGRWIAGANSDRINKAFKAAAVCLPIVVRFQLEIVIPTSHTNACVRCVLRTIWNTDLSGVYIPKEMVGVVASFLRMGVPMTDNPFAHIDLEFLKRLQFGDRIDHRDDVGRYLTARIAEKHGSLLKVHYERWHPKWDVYSDYTEEPHRFALPRNISRLKVPEKMEVKVRDFIDINPVHRHCGWRFGQVRRVDKYSGQVQVVYREGGDEYLYWVHLNNPKEAAPFESKSEAKSPKVKTDDDLAEEKQMQPMRKTDSILPGAEEHFVAHMDAASAERLQPGDCVDHRDDVGRYLLAEIVAKNGSSLKVHYKGWNRIFWDVYSDYTQELHRFAAPKTISRQRRKKMFHLKVGDFIDVKPLQRHLGWRFGQVRRVDLYSGQVQVVYKERGNDYLHWVHLNNPEEAADFRSKAK